MFERVVGLGHLGLTNARLAISIAAPIFPGSSVGRTVDC
jgi:hypothetical protein